MTARPLLPRIKGATRILLGIAFALAGANHFVHTEFYLAMMPPYLPAHLLLVQASGVCEMLCGCGLLVPRWSRHAAWCTMAVTLGVYPANIHMALHHELFPQFSATALWIRLPLQAVILAWAYWYTRRAVVPATLPASAAPHRRGHHQRGVRNDLP